MAYTLVQLNQAPPAQALAMLEGLYPQAPWVAQQALAARPLRSLAQLKYLLIQQVTHADNATQLALIRACPALGNERDLLNSGCGPEEAAELRRLDTEYTAKFGFPFVLDLLGPRGTGLNPTQTLAHLKRRLQHPADFEHAEALRNIHRIAELRLDKKFAAPNALGRDIWDWQEKLSVHTDPGYAELQQLTVTYLTDAHRACAQRISNWMHDCGFDEVQIDAVGNVVGRYKAAAEDAPILLTGSHYDTVRNGGKYDGRLGIFVPMACVRELHRKRRRLPFQIEVVGFAEEEGQRYKATFLASGALIGDFKPAWLEQQDADGISMREAMLHAGLCIADIPKIKRDPRNYLGFVEVHIEQGPVLCELNIPLGIVVSINGSVRYLAQISGMACHAGTTPMSRRRDAAAATAELILYIEARATRDGDSVGTVGMLEVPNGSINVVPGLCRFSMDLRAPTDAQRDALAQDVLAELQAICARRGLHCECEETMRAAAAPSAPEWQQRWERAVAALGVPLHRMNSGAGHDAMKMHEIMPQAMLFVRGQNSGISHNPLESSNSDDMQLAAEAFGHLLEELAQDLPQP